MSERLVGPTTIRCLNACDVPEGFEMVETPRPRHAWVDVVRCPNDRCDRAFLIVKRPGGER